MKRFQYQDCIHSRLKKISRKVESIYRKNLTDFDITVPQLNILLIIETKGEVDQSFIGSFLLLEKSSVSRNLLRLIEHGYVFRDDSNYKKVLSLTAKGRVLVKKIQPYWEKSMDEISTLLGSQGLKSLEDIESLVL
jgi:DNA-binding MarR family transcriptional regulator